MDPCGRDRWQGRALVTAALAVVLAGVVACSEGLVGPVPREIRIGDWTTAPDDPSLRLLAADDYTGLAAPERRVIRSGDAWAALWDAWESNRSPRTDPPAVDFDREMVIVAALGTRPSGGYGIAIASVTETGGEVVVGVRTLRPGDRCIVTAALTAPAAAVTAPATSKPVRFEETAYVMTCD